MVRGLRLPEPMPRVALALGVLLLVACAGAPPPGAQAPGTQGQGRAILGDAKTPPGAVTAEGEARAELERQLALLEGRFEAMWRAREQVLRALEGRPKLAPLARDGAKEGAKDGEPATASDRGVVFSRCRTEALDVIREELSLVERQLFHREWELSPTTLRLRWLEQRLLRLEDELVRPESAQR